jgi:hypothetical protein
LTLVPKFWTYKKIMSEFETTNYMVRESKKMLEKDHFFCARPQVKRKIISEDIVQKIVRFYESEDNGRILPGKKDYLSIRTDNGKEHKQKHLLLSNLKELYLKWCTENPTLKTVGFSTFAALRPKWCVLAGASGTHSVCVCVLHQNPKLKCDAAKIKDIRDLIALCVCDTGNYDCMAHFCENCPGTQALTEFLQNTVPDSQTISYKQWISTDRNSLIDQQQDRDDFIDSFVQDILNLTLHHYLAKAQSSFLQVLKERILTSEAIILMDFSENYSVVIQDAIQSSYWSKTQVTLHPFVIYYKTETGLESKSVSIISDSLNHSVSAVHCFIETMLLNVVKKDLPDIKKYSTLVMAVLANIKTGKVFR